jgi:DNA polymerase-4
MDLDSFFVSVERLLDPSLHGKPVLVGGSSERGVVASCSYEARAFGIHSAMPMRRAVEICPQAVIVKGDHEKYGYYSGIVTDIISDNVPVFEKSSIDEFYVDMTGMDKFFGCYKLASEIRQKIMKETSLPISFALASNKTVAKIGTGQANPNGPMEIAPGTEKEFLAPLSIRKIPMLGKKSYEILSARGIEKISQMQNMSVDQVHQLLGDMGITLWNKANGICNSEVEPYSERKSISSECTFEADTYDVLHLKRVMVNMTEKLSFQLRTEEHLTGCASVKIRYSDFSTFSMQATIPYTCVDKILIEKIKQLFDKLYSKKKPV